MKEEYRYATPIRRIAAAAKHHHLEKSSNSAAISEYRGDRHLHAFFEIGKGELLLADTTVRRGADKKRLPSLIPRGSTTGLTLGAKYMRKRLHYFQ
ncbi:MAG TPA: hypothetical protein VGK99_01040 [Acidobacteriota bacterium]